MSLFRSLVLVLFAVPAPLLAQDIEPQPAEQVPLADESLILDITRAGERYVAVGERGHVLISRDGIEWEQAEQVPVQAALTRVDFAGGRLWAVGHDTTIIHSSDLGRTWNLQHFEPAWERPLLDVHFFNSSEGLAVGAYGLIMKTGDGGQSWESMDMVDVMTSEAIDWSDAAAAAYELADTPEDETDPSDEFYDASQDFDRGCYEFIECHLNAILVNDDGRIMLAGERGYGFRSSDRGESWESFRFPYPGSMFGLLPVRDSVLAFGLRGNVQLSSDFGDSWEVLDSGVDSTLLGGALDPDGKPVMVGSGATILTFHPPTGDFRVSEDRLGSDYAAVLFTVDGGMILAGEEGLKHE
ncbi:hypothetical protein G4Y73_09615 [Wenzhouxiangella sp. XN201]|uniref:WD40/YVTN/BNR-like repeat-containing protein n=1 Tax=Wenzhouxiangella sp. XN201 TaxID=2710755 RepID=UPI0013CCEB2D|nr:YCF48-related protein [Wenzhouxiangella sp. XN201]NEZ04402.1 hypothetical protein [Wenzhouxiangella sp. XN201]